MMLMPDSLRSWRQQLLSGQLNRSECLAATLENIAQQSHLNAFIAAHSSIDQLDEGISDGPLAGIPFSVKDNILSKAFATTTGSPLLVGFNPGRNAEIIDRLQAAGAVLVGKNNLPEFCQSMSCNNATFGQVENPAVPGHIPGGSSGGSGAAVVAGLVPFSIASDTGGSVQIPAALCGCAGFRASTGRYPTDGFVPVSPMFDTPGIIARTVNDIALLDQVITREKIDSSESRSLQKLRIGVPRTYFYDDLHPEVAALTERALTRLEEAGIAVIEADIANIAEANSRVGFPIAFYDMLREIAVFMAREGFSLSISELVNGTVGMAEKQAIQSQLRDAAIPHPVYIEAIRTHLPNYLALIDRYFQDSRIDLIAVPTVPLPAVKARALGEDIFVHHNGRDELMFTTYIRNTEPMSNYGGPCLTLPAGKTADGKPVGMELIGRRGHDRQLLALAYELEPLLNGPGH